MVGRIEASGPIRVVSISAEGRVHDDDEAALEAARVLFRGGLSEAVLEHLLTRTPNLEWIHSVSAGVERVAIPGVLSRGLVVTNGRGVFSRPIAEYVVMMLLSIARRLPQLLELQRERTWQPLGGRELSGLTLGILGFGSIGADVAALLQPFGTRILATRRHPERGPGAASNVQLLSADRLAELLRASDVVLVALPLTEETAGVIGAEELQQMRPDAWLINIARGRLVDEAALRRALAAGSIGGAVLDVFTEEPLPIDSPLYGTPNLVLTPHSSWASDRVAERSIELFADNLRRYLAGEPLHNVVDLQAGY
ncbi:MAG TPA: D-2-hydroxyacid dehydrogenase [Candidatus Limnocylindria bacterium]|nr:D-2-hydroxyacid dehydrogenase [Candidatus Limnocylindria bacterium]